MMIFKKHENRGSLILPTVFGVLGVIIAMGLFRFLLVQYRAANRNAAEASLLMSTHSLASLFKEDLIFNYQKYSNAVDATWTACRTGPISPAEFLNILNAPTAYPAGCSAVPLTFTQIQTNEPTPLSVFPLSMLFTKELRPITNINGLTYTFRINTINTDPERTQVFSDVLISKKTAGVYKRLQMVIDIARTVSIAPRRLTGKICRNTPGLVCDSTDGVDSFILFSFLDGTGRIMRVSFNERTEITVLQYTGSNANPLAWSVKQIDTGPITYHSDKFCIPSVQGNTPLRFIEDAASNTAGTSYFLTVHGKLLRTDGTNAWAALDPKIISIGYTQDTWLLLRSDGAILRTTTIENQASQTRVPNLQIPNADKIVSGNGPAPCT